MAIASKPPVILVHGAFCGSWTFEHMVDPLRLAGHEVHAPDLPGHGAADDAQSVTGQSMRDYVRHIARLSDSLAETGGKAPILVGHSLGGLVCQMVARQSPPTALVLMAPSPPWGTGSTSMEEAMTAMGLNLLGPLWWQSVRPDLGLMRNFSLNRMPKSMQDEALRQLRPESGRALWEALHWWQDPFMTTSLGPGPLNLPALVLVGSRDVVHPPATARMIAQRIGADYQELRGMSHWLPGEPEHGQVTQTILDWLDQLPHGLGA